MGESVNTSVPNILQDIPLAALQVLMTLLPLESHVDLRQVSQSIFKRITQHVSLQLSRDSSVQQLQQWHKLSQRLEDITTITVYITGQVDAVIFELAMDLLSKRTTPVTELHLLAGPKGCIYAHDMCPSAYLSTLRPLHYLAHQLKTLKILGIANRDMASSLQQLASAAAAGGWSNLTNLSLHVLQSQLVPTDWAGFFRAVQHLGTGFQNLEQLDVTVPPLEWPSTASILAKITLIQVLGDDVSCTTAYCAQVAIIAELAAVALHLKRLQVLRITEVPDAWAGKQLASASASAQLLHHMKHQMYQGPISRTTGAVPRIQSALSERAEAGGLIAAYVSAGLLPAVSCLATLDNLGCCLLEQHGKLCHVHIGIEGNRFAMTWQDSHNDSNSSGKSFLAGYGAAEASAGHSSTATSRHSVIESFSFKSADLHHPIRRADSINSSTMLSGDLLSDFSKHLSWYSSRPPSELLQLISSLSLELPYDDVDKLAELFSELKSLEKLEISFKLKKPVVPGDWPNMSAFDVEDAAIRAAGSLPSRPCIGITAESNPRFSPGYVPCFCHSRVCICNRGY